LNMSSSLQPQSVSNKSGMAMIFRKSILPV
jgi:hypothetical protein